jgi:hypothetical protein
MRTVHCESIRSFSQERSAKADGPQRTSPNFSNQRNENVRFRIDGGFEGGTGLDLCDAKLVISGDTQRKARAAKIPSIKKTITVPLLSPSFYATDARDDPIRTGC